MRIRYLTVHQSIRHLTNSHGSVKSADLEALWRTWYETIYPRWED